MKIIGLTGGIASGKSTVSRMLSDLGAEIIDADNIAREIVEPGMETLKRIVENFGSSVLNPDGTLDRKALGYKVFNNSEKLNLLNEITHPEIRRIIKERVSEIRERDIEKNIVVDAAVLIESGMNDLVDEVWVVYVDHDTQVMRLMKRDNMTLEEAEMRIRSQMSFNEKIKYSPRIIDNSMDLEHTKEQVEALWSYLDNNGGGPVEP
jgi:dephospho-CoA kinase